jgi:uncharacterized protein
VKPDPVEIRVAGCLVEKQRTTPDTYPLTLNALRLACNQSTNRDPVVDYDESIVRAALNRLTERKWATLASWSNRRSMKYRHTLDSALGVSDSELALLCVLMLRGAQTPGELKQRSDRLQSFTGIEEVEATLRGLIERELVAEIPRRPGQREDRFMHLLGGDAEPTAEPPPPDATQAAEPPPADATPQAAPPAGGPDDRLARLEGEVEALRTDVEQLRRELGV